MLFAQTFLHPHLDEYVDEVLFAEPVVVTACEFIEQSASSASPSVALLGATSPPSFALEVFVQCEGTRFRRLCHPFLYSHSSSNVLEVEAVVTNHLVVRGSYRSLSLVIYGNTAEDLGQFNIEVGLESSLTNTVSSAEGKLEDLPPGLYPSNLSIEDLLSYPKALSLPVVSPDISIEVKKLLELAFKILRFRELGDKTDKVISLVVSVASSYYVSQSCLSESKLEKTSLPGRCGHFKDQSNYDLSETRKELFDVYNSLPRSFENLAEESAQDNGFLECEEDLATSKQLVEILSKYFHPGSTCENPQVSTNKSIILWLGTALLLCSARESCFHFVNSGGMAQLELVFCRGMEKNSIASTLMLLGVVEQATRLSIGCEGFLGWWPREDESIPSSKSAGYNDLLKLLLRKQPHDVSSLTTHVLHRLRFYEVASRYESAVTSLFSSLPAIPATDKVTSISMDKLIGAKFQLKTLMKLINARGPIEDPSPWASASKSLLLGDSGVLSYKSTCSLITSSSCWFPIWDIDPHLLFLLKDRGFFALSAALLSSSILRSETGHAMDVFVDIVQYFGAIILSLLFCRSGLVFLLLHPELSTTVVQALKGADILKRKEPIPLRYASTLISKGFFCHPEEIGMIVELHLRVVNAVDRLLTCSLHSEEILWVLWELCGLSRSYCGREALAALGHFPEAVLLLISALHSIKEMDPVASSSGVSPLNLAVFHSSAEIFEVIVTDQTSFSLGCWIGHVAELDRALHSYSTGSNRKDAPTRLLEWIDASIIYYKKGAAGLLQYAAVLATGGDAHIASINILSSDTVDAENNVGDHSRSSVSNLIENLLGKPITENNYRAAVLRDSSVAQLTTGFRILALIAENSAVAAALYDEGAVMVIHAVLIDCVLMLERSSNNYDYLVDDGTEGNSTSDLLLERNREQSIFDLLIPSLVLLITLFQRLKETKEQHRNTKLMKALLQLHREMSPRLAACTSDLSSPNPGSALGLEAVCHLIVSALACWSTYGWTPGLFSFLVDSLHATTSPALGPREACSLLCLLNDLLPEEGFLVWKNGTPMVSALRTLAVGTLLGPQKERQVCWYLQPIHVEKLMNQLKPQLDKIGQVILHCAISTLVVVQDMLRILINRIACLGAEKACKLLRPLVSSIRDCINKPLSSNTDAYKVHRLLHFLSLLLEHPRAKALLLKEGVLQIFIEVLERCVNVANSDGKHFYNNRNIANSEFSQLAWCIPASKCLSLVGDRHDFGNLTVEDCSCILSSLLQLCRVLPVGKELLTCLTAFEALGSFPEGRNALQLIFSQIQSSRSEEFDSDDKFESRGGYDQYYAREWRKSPPLLCCLATLLKSLDSKDVNPDYAIEAVGALSSGVLHYSIDEKRDMVVVMKYLFGLPSGASGADDFPEENIKYIEDLIHLLRLKTRDDMCTPVSSRDSIMYHVKDSAESMLLLLQKPTAGSVKAEDIIYFPACTFSSSGVSVPSKLRKMANGTVGMADDYNLLDGLSVNFFWECPLSHTSFPLKRKMSNGDNLPSEAAPNTLLSRGSGSPNLPYVGPNTTVTSRRGDSFRLRKPNTSRPPSMHVDDYVARERNVDGNTNSNVITVQTRVGSTSSSGRPPSIHVDEFMARQRERHNPLVGSMTKSAILSQSNSTDDVVKFSAVKPEELKKPENLDDDDLQGIDIVFDGEEEIETDDKLPFLQQDVDLSQSVTVAVDQGSPHSIVAETESDVNESSHFSHLDGPVLPSNVNDEENTRGELVSRVSDLCPDKALNREPSISSDRKYNELFEDSKNVPVKNSGKFISNSSGYSSSVNNRRSSPSAHLPNDSRTAQQVYPKSSHQQYGRTTNFQPPLPPMPPPPSLLSSMSQLAEHHPSQSSPFVSSPPVYHAHGNVPDLKYNRTPSSSPGTSRPPPPLPPTPPPYSAAYNQTINSSGETFQNAFNDPRMVNVSTPLLTSYPPLSLMPPMLFNRPVGSMPTGPYSSSPTPHQGENPLQNLSLPHFQPQIQSLKSSVSHLQPLQPPQILRPQHPQSSQHHHRPPSPQITPEQGVTLLQSPPVQMQLHQPVQVLQQQQPQVSPVYYQQSPHQSGDGTSQQQDPALSLQHYFSSPEAIQSLLSDRDKLCQLLEQHPKLMQLLQEKLGQR